MSTHQDGNGGKRKGPRQDKATLGGETVEPRILLSTTWIWGTLGNDTLSGTAADETIDAAYGNDVVNGGGGHDVVSYSMGLTGGVHVDLTLTGAQDTVHGGMDTLSNVEGVEGTIFGDVFRFSAPVDGATYSVTGNFGSDVIDLSNFDSSAITFGDHTMTVDLGSGHAFHINYDTVESIQFGDIGASVIAGDFGLDNFTGHHIYLEGDNAFSLEVNGNGGMSWSYAAGTNTLSVVGTNGADASTSLHIDDLNTDALIVDHVTLTERIGSLNSEADIGDLHLQSNDAPAAITIHGGTGTIHSLHGNNLDSATVVDAQVDTVELTGHLKGDLSVTGDVGKIAIDTLEGNLTVHGNLGSLVITEHRGGITIDGHVGTIDIHDVDSGATLNAQNYKGDIAAEHDALSVATSSLVATTTLPVDAATAAALATAPTADAGVDVVVADGTRVTLDATDSVDPDGDELTYLWVQVSGPTVVLDDPTSATPTFTAPELVADSGIKFLLAVSDGTSIAYDTVVVMVDASNDAPVANAGNDFRVREGGVATLNGTASMDPEGRRLTYSWVQTSGVAVVLSDARASSPSFTAPEGLANSDVTFQLTVSDGTSTSVDAVTVHINADNDAVRVVAGSDQTATVGQEIRLGARAHDPEGQALTYTWTQVSGPRATLSGADTAQATFTAPTAKAGETMVFQIAVSDGENTTIDTLAVTFANSGPTVDASAQGLVSSGSTAALVANASDVNNDDLTYRWSQIGGPTALLNGSSSQYASFEAPTVGGQTELLFQVEVSDGTATTTRVVSVTVQPPLGGGPPAPGAEPVAETAGENPTISAQPETHPTVGSDQTNQPSTQVPIGSDSSYPGYDPFATSSSTNHQSADSEVSESSSPSLASVSHQSDVEDQAAKVEPTADASVEGNSAAAVEVDSTIPIVVTAGADIELAPSLPVPVGAEVHYTWTQVAGSSVNMLDAGAKSLRIEMPKTFTAEDLVFQVEMQIGDEIVTQEIIVQVEPVATAVRAGAHQFVQHSLPQEVEEAKVESRGVGKVWASLLAFSSTGRPRR